MLNRKFASIMAAAVVLVGMASSSFAVTFQPNPNDLNDLDHFYYYTWGINYSIPSGHTISSAALIFDNIQNWDDQPNDLYVHLLPSGTLGVTSGYDAEGGGDNFVGQGVLLAHYVNLPNSPQDITYNFTPSALGFLTTYTADGNFALAFDPDCHYWNDGIKLKIYTEKIPDTGTPPPGVPEPTTAALSGMVLAAASGLFMSRRNRKA